MTNPDQITELFDTITYSKGASIIRMLEEFVGAELFQKAVSNYLKAHKYQNAVTGDLVSELEQLLEAAGLDYDVEFIMKTWTEQMGYPVVNVQLVGGNQYRLTQKRFLSNPDSEAEAEKDVGKSKFKYAIYLITFGSNIIFKVLIVFLATAGSFRSPGRLTRTQPSARSGSTTTPTKVKTCRYFL